MYVEHVVIQRTLQLEILNCLLFVIENQESWQNKVPNIWFTGQEIVTSTKLDIRSFWLCPCVREPFTQLQAKEAK